MIAAAQPMVLSHPPHHARHPNKVRDAPQTPTTGTRGQLRDTQSCARELAELVDQAARKR